MSFMTFIFFLLEFVFLHLTLTLCLQAFSSEDKTKREKKKGDYEIEGGSLNTMEENFAKR